MNVLTILTDAYDAGGGIAEYNVQLVEAIHESGLVDRLDVLSMRATKGTGARPSERSVPEGMHWKTLPRTNKVGYSLGSIKHAITHPFDVVVCGHINLAPLGAALKRMGRNRKMITITYGADIWVGLTPLKTRAFDDSDLATALTDYTRERLLEWSTLPRERIDLLYATADEDLFTFTRKPAHLQKRYGTQGKKVILTVGRLATVDSYKGHDRVIRAMPAILRQRPDTVYLIVGDGDDRPRLEGIVRETGMEDHVIFAGLVDAGELVDHYRVADLFAMPSTGEGFGIVYLEAACCGIPSVACTDDAGGEVVSLIGGTAVQSSDAVGLVDAVLGHLGRRNPRKRIRQSCIDTFGLAQFKKTTADILKHCAEL